MWALAPERNYVGNLSFGKLARHADFNRNLTQNTPEMQAVWPFKSDKGREGRGAPDKHTGTNTLAKQLTAKGVTPHAGVISLLLC